jgi:tetratricopeptide (TPR) repeat protein
MNRMRWTLVLSATLMVASTDAFAQRGGVRGKLVDEGGKPVEGVSCNVELAGGGGRASTVVSKKDGLFVKNGVQAGTYTVSCTKDGFRKVSMSAQVSGFEQTDLGQHILYRLAPGELSEKDAAQANALLEKFKSTAGAEDNQTALNSLLDLDKLMPDNAEIQANIAATYEKMNDPDKALEYYMKAGELKPDFYEVWAAIGDIQGRKKQWAEAAAAMKKAVDLKATDPVVVFNYGVFCQNAGDPDAAQMAYEKVIGLDPGRAMAYYQLGLIAAGRGDNPTALAHFEKFLEIAPNDPQAAAAKDVIEALKAKSP